MTTSAPTIAPAPPALAAGPASPDELVGRGRAETSRHLRAGVLVAASGGLALAVAAALAASAPRPSLLAGAIVLGCYALASRVGFEVAHGFALPTQLVLVPALFLLPPRWVPLTAAAAMVLGQLPEVARRRMPADRLLLSLTNAWPAVGPAVVLVAAGHRSPRSADAPVYLLALAAQFAFDFAGAAVVARAAVSMRPLAQLRLMLPAFAVDACLAPLGLLAAFAADGRPPLLLLVLPLVALLAYFARERQVRIDHALELSQAYRGTALLLGDVIEADHAYTGSHSRDVVELTLAVCDRLGLEAGARREAELAALLHDVGKVRIPSSVLDKAGPLDDDEWALMKTHTIEGERMLETVGGLLGRVGRIVRSCHERWDGGGYPDGLAGEEIPLAARIVCACDAYNAMTTDRAYRAALPAAAAQAELRSCAGTHFDPRVVEALLAALATGSGRGA